MGCAWSTSWLVQIPRRIHRPRPCPCMSVPRTSGNVPRASPRSTNVQLLVRRVRSAGNILVADRVVVLFLSDITTITIIFDASFFYWILSPHGFRPYHQALLLRLGRLAPLNETIIYSTS
ncbi:hypothetical protein BJY00DRAFT_140533 [Aspergillus carlsbadensis]|nr:hypothetical protein BJY00DRAFT_140533 [Aspergillus carlsbadensis]